MENINNSDITLLKQTFSNLEKLMPQVAGADQEKIEKICQIVRDRFDADYCKRVYNIIHAEYKILPNRNREMLESRIGIHFNGQVTSDEATRILNVILFNLEEVSEETDFLAKQIQASMGMGQNASADDEVENPEGKFGFTETNPIPVNGIDMIDDYFSKLRLITGELISYSRKGSVIAPNLPHPVDMYHIFNSESDHIATLYIYAYHGKKSDKAPEGFKLIK